jgi:hypothetical protein
MPAEKSSIRGRQRQTARSFCTTHRQTPQMRLIVGAGVGLNHGSSGTIRLLTEYEWV